MNTHHRDTAGTLMVSAYTRAASGFLVGLEHAEANGRPLSQLQAIDLLMAIIQAHDGASEALASDLAITDVLAHGLDLPKAKWGA